MSLKDLLPPGTFDEIASEAGLTQDTQTLNRGDNPSVIKVRCPTCGKESLYSAENPFRPFCSERCRLIDLGAWANEERSVPGRDVNEDEDADLLSDPDLPVRGRNNLQNPD